MRIIYIHQYFKTPQEGGAVRSYHLAKGLADAGHEVELITGSNEGSYDQRWIAGVKVHFLPVAYNQKYGFIRRGKAFLSYVRQSKRLIKKLKRADLLYITSTPLTTGLLGLWAKKTLAIPYIFEVRDLWPRAPIEVGAIKSPILKRLLIGLEKKIYSQALSIVALSPGIARHIKEVVPERTVHLIPNFSDLEVFYPQEKNESVLSKYGFRNTLTIAYTGALGMVNAVDELILLAELAQQKDKNWQFLIMGEGSHEASLKELANRKELQNIHFIPFGSKAKVNEILSLADFAWISFAPFPVLKTNSPNKFFDAIASGKAVIVNHKGWVYDLMKTHHLGLACLPGKMEMTFAKIEDLEKDPERLIEMGKNSRSIAERFFAKEQAIEKLNNVIFPDHGNDKLKSKVVILTA